MFNKNGKKFKLFDMNRDGPGVSKEEGPLKPNLWNLPKFYFRQFTKVLSLNFAMLPLILLPAVLFYVYVTAPSMPTETDPSFAPLFGIYTANPTPGLISLLGVYGFQLPLQTYDTVRIAVTVAIGIVFAALWGWINVGAAFCTRGMFRGDPVFIWSDFTYAIKRNLWQGLFVGLLDFACIAVLIFDFIYFSSVGGTFVLDFFYFASFGVCLVFMFMRYYVYTMLVTFDIKFRKLLKNSLIFSVLGIKRNLMTLLAIFLVVAVNALIALALWPFGLEGVAIILPAIYLLPTIALFKTYGAYPVIEKYMIKKDE